MLHSGKKCLIYIVETPDAPKGPLKAYDIKKDSISLSWQPPEYDGGSPLTGYIIEKFDNKVGGWMRATRLTPDVTDYTVTGFTRGREYNFRVYAENKLGASEPIELPEAVIAKSDIGKRE